jgi:hypothetical protein
VIFHIRFDTLKETDLELRRSCYQSYLGRIEDRIEKRMLLDNEVQLLKSGNDATIYELPLLEEEDKCRDVFPFLPFSTPPKQHMEKRQL